MNLYIYFLYRGGAANAPRNRAADLQRRVPAEAVENSARCQPVVSMDIRG